MLNMKQKGFTLVELIVVLAILAVLSAIMVPSLTGYIDKAKNTQLISIARSVYTAAQVEVSEAYARGPIYVNDGNDTLAIGNFPSIKNIVTSSELKEWGMPGKDYVDKTSGFNYLVNGYGFNANNRGNYHFKILISTDGKIEELTVCAKDKSAVLKDGTFEIKKTTCKDSHGKSGLFNFIFTHYNDTCKQKYDDLFIKSIRYNKS